MSRKLRFIPDGGSLVEVTCRTIQGRLLMRPSPQLNEIILGVLGRAQRLYPLEILGYVFTSNHYHLLLRVDTAERLSQFMGYFSGNLAREIARLTGWNCPICTEGLRQVPLPVDPGEDLADVGTALISTEGLRLHLLDHVPDSLLEGDVASLRLAPHLAGRTA